MSNTKLYSLIALVALAAAAAGADAPLKTVNIVTTEADAAAFVPGQVIVLFDDDVTAADMDRVVAEVGGEVLTRSAADVKRLVVTVPAGSEDLYVSKYAAAEGVRAAEKNYVYNIMGGS